MGGLINRSKISKNKAAPAPRTPKPTNTNPTQYFFDDPSTPDMSAMMSIDPTPLPVVIQGYAGGGQPVGTLGQQAASCAITIGKTLRYIASHSKKPITRWVRGNALTVLPRAGQDLNAYYDRNYLKFFYVKDPVTQKTVFTSDAVSVVAHELGHGILDILRPDFWNTQAMEVWSFHEAYGDCNAILAMLQHDQVMQFILSETNSDLTKTNFATKIGKQMGLTASHLFPRDGYNPECLRNAANDFKYTAPERLRKVAPDNVLSNEPHSFSKVWTGAWWEILAKLQKKLALSMDPLSAFRQARDIGAEYLLFAIADVPLTARLYDALARQMLVVDGLRGSPHRSILLEVFNRREILANKVTALSNLSVRDVMEKDAQVQKTSHGTSVYIKKTLVKKLTDNKVYALSGKTPKFNPLFNLSVELPMDCAYHFNKDGILTDAHEGDEEEAMEAARECVNYLHANKLVSSSDKTPFEVQGDKLVRSHICGGCCGLSNACDPNAPEYGKGFKGKNNAGCGCCKADPVCDCGPPPPPAPRPKLGCVTTVKGGGISRYVRGYSPSRRVC